MATHYHDWQAFGSDVDNIGRACGERVLARCVNAGCWQRTRSFTRLEWNDYNRLAIQAALQTQIDWFDTFVEGAANGRTSDRSPVDPSE